MVEPPNGSLTVEPAYRILMVEHLKVPLLIGWGGLDGGGRAPDGPYGRAPNGSLTVEPAFASLSVEHLKVRVYLLGGGVSMVSLTPVISRGKCHTVEPASASSMVEPPNGSLTVEPATKSASLWSST